jgi:hypothetical protein
VGGGNKKGKREKSKGKNKLKKPKYKLRIDKSIISLLCSTWKNYKS